MASLTVGVSTRSGIQLAPLAKKAFSIGRKLKAFAPLVGCALQSQGAQANAALPTVAVQALCRDQLHRDLIKRLLTEAPRGHHNCGFLMLSSALQRLRAAKSAWATSSPWGLVMLTRKRLPRSARPF